MSTTIRSIDELLALSTYQGMTDEEIDSLIDYKINKAINTVEMTTKLNAIKESEQQIVTDNYANAAALLSMVQSMQQLIQPISGVGAVQTVTPSSAEVSNG